MADALPEVIDITVCLSPCSGTVQEALLQLAAGSTVQQALDAVTASAALPDLQLPEPLAADMLGIWGKVANPGQILKHGDRLEVYRPLTVDPKVARRERFARQGARGAGLFKRQRDGAKAGY
ncbi:RnfH family protein [Comamonas testosteroni]|uniref:RnfH family protein n=1 Tax=Comamonas testosteroni TaxID=285 RepID=UPI0023AB0122|nr:RnfH family protein [Comamonas testosteroni]WEE75363.1 RnfH family protein [Comamonas testosteroni]